jgi:hypothetical protein
MDQSDLESKLLPSIWNDKIVPTRNHNNTPEEQRFLHSQLHGGDLWYSSDFPQSTHANHGVQRSSSSQELESCTQSVFDVKVSNNSNFLPSQQQQYTASTTPLSVGTPPPSMSQYSSFGGMTPLSQTHSTMQQGSFGTQFTQHVQPQLQQVPQPPQVQLLQVPQIQNQMTDTQQLLNNTQTLLQSYQQQQGYPEQLQTQQQAMLQNPLFLQQQAQLVSQQLQQLQLQLQIQQQQIESLSKKDDKLPLTQENLTKLESKDAVEPSTKSTHSQENKVNTVLYKTELCSTFQKTGTCPYGSKCQFAHGEPELKAVDRGSKWRSKPCANWSKTGSCRYGNRCCFKHGD